MKLAYSPGAMATQNGRDLRLDFFRGVAMLIILVAHIRGNTWALWIPARFGFSDATEVFVFCSGLASAHAFGALFIARGLWLGTVRIAFRVWQVYWAHIGMVLVSMALLVAIDLNAWGEPGRVHVEEPFVVPFFSDPGPMLIGLLTLRYVPNLFDILPMYLVILAMIPVVMAVHAVRGPRAVIALSVMLWLCATLTGHRAAAGRAGPLLGEDVLDAVAVLSFLDLPALPGGDLVWFFNPFAWQLVFFTGFAVGMGWVRVPQPTPQRVGLALAVLAASVPLAWFRLHEPGFWLPPDSPLQQSLSAWRDLLSPLHAKTWLGGLRYIHFVALAYLMWALVGTGGVRLSHPLPLRATAGPRRQRLAAVAALLGLATAPYVHGAALGGWTAAVPWAGEGWTGAFHVLHAAALVSFAWHVLPSAWCAWIAGPGWLALVRLVCKVGTQSLAVFVVSVPLALVLAVILDHTGRDLWTTAIANISGFAILVGLAYVLGWIKGHPWRRPAPAVRSSFAGASTPAE